MGQIAGKKIGLLDEGLLRGQGRCGRRLEGTLREATVQRDLFNFVDLAPRVRFFRKAATSAPLLNGP